MSNIRRLSDFNDNRNNPRGQRNASLFGPGFQQFSTNPRQETFASFIKNFCCPFFNLNSFIFIITVIDVIMYVVTVVYDGIADVKTYGLLAPTYKALDVFGMAVS